MRTLSLLTVALLHCSFAFAQVPSLLSSDGVIHNSGTIRVYGDARIAQDTITGLVEYQRDNADSQLVAHTTYKDLRFQGRSLKIMSDATRPVVSYGLFHTVDTVAVIRLSPTTWIEANGTVRHNGLINPGRRDGTVKLRGTLAQELTGTGLVPILEMDNDSGVAVTEGLGVRVVERLDLQRGVLSVSSQDNLRIQRDAWVWRNWASTTSDYLVYNQQYSLRYYGDSVVFTEREVPREVTALAHLRQDAPQGLFLTRDVTVNDSLIVNAHIHTELDDTTRYTLFYTSQKDPVYGGRWPEVDGTMERTNLVVGRPMRMNHEFSTLMFPRSADQGSVRRIRLRMKPKTLPLPLDDILFKNQRFMQLQVLTDARQLVPDSTYDMTMAWGWRARYDSTFEQPGVVETIPQIRNREEQAVLLRYYDDSYQQYGFTQPPTLASNDPFSMWQHSSSQFIRASGDYAIGLSTGPIWVLNARLLLEGAMRSTGDSVAPVMATDLAQRGLLPNIAPRVYPYSLDNILEGDTAIAIGDSIVDWVVVEFRYDAISNGNPALVETLLLTKEGRLLDPVTLRPKVIAGIGAGFYHLAVRHRNHLSIITEQPILVDRSNIRTPVDFTRGVNLLGGAGSTRLLATFEGRRFFGMSAGNIDGGNALILSAEGINRTDMAEIWANRQLIDAYSVFDTNLDGVVTTLDWNLSWNNRNRDNSVVPR